MDGDELMKLNGQSIALYDVLDVVGKLFLTVSFVMKSFGFFHAGVDSVFTLTPFLNGFDLCSVLCLQVFVAADVLQKILKALFLVFNRTSTKIKIQSRVIFANAALLATVRHITSGIALRRQLLLQLSLKVDHDPYSDRLLRREEYPQVVCLLLLE